MKNPNFIVLTVCTAFIFIISVQAKAQPYSNRYKKIYADTILMPFHRGNMKISQHINERIATNKDSLQTHRKLAQKIKKRVTIAVNDMIPEVKKKDIIKNPHTSAATEKNTLRTKSSDGEEIFNMLANLLLGAIIAGIIATLLGWLLVWVLGLLLSGPLVCQIIGTGILLLLVISAIVDWFKDIFNL